jgi:hypothetical protein
MVSYVLKLGAAATAFLVVGIVVILIFDAIWFRVGIGAALVLVFGGVLLLAWRADRKAREARAGLDRI